MSFIYRILEENGHRKGFKSLKEIPFKLHLGTYARQKDLAKVAKIYDKVKCHKNLPMDLLIKS